MRSHPSITHAPLVVLILTASLPLTFSTANAERYWPGTVEICHWSDEDLSYHLIEVEAHAGEAHMAHGDIEPYYLAVYDDADGDGYGNPEVPIRCPPYEDTVENDDDCNDDDPRAWLNAPEWCDGIDNDCNDIIDDGPPEWSDGLDNDCDGEVDEDPTECPCFSTLEDTFTEFAALPDTTVTCTGYEYTYSDEGEYIDLRRSMDFHILYLGLPINSIWYLSTAESSIGEPSFESSFCSYYRYRPSPGTYETHVSSDMVQQQVCSAMIRYVAAENGVYCEYWEVAY